MIQSYQVSPIPISRFSSSSFGPVTLLFSLSLFSTNIPLLVTDFFNFYAGRHIVIFYTAVYGLLNEAATEFYASLSPVQVKTTTHEADDI